MNISNIQYVTSQQFIDLLVASRNISFVLAHTVLEKCFNELILLFFNNLLRENIAVGAKK